MKKFFLAVVLVIIGITAVQGQTEKGTWLLGGNISFQASEGSTLFTATPNIGIFVANNIAVGGQVTLLASDGYTAWAIGPFVRGYFAGSEKGKFFGQLGLNVGGAEGSDTEIGFGIGAGYALFLNRSIAIELGANYNKTGDNNGIFGLGAGFQIHFKK